MKFLTTFLVLFSVCVGIYKIEIYNKIYSHNVFKINQNKTHVFFGDSQTQYAIDDTVDKSILNLGYRSEKFHWSFRKMINVIESNDHIKEVTLSLSYHSFAKNNEVEILGKDRSFFYTRYGAILENEDYVYLAKVDLNKDLLLSYLKHELYVPLEVSKDLKLYLRHKRNMLVNNDLPFWGYFQKDFSNDLSSKSLKTVYKRHFSKNTFSEIQIDYFKRIINYMKKKNIKFQLVTLPLQQKYRNKVPRKQKEFFNKMISYAADEGVKHYNYSEYNLANDMFKDYDHLNHIGANKFTNFYMGANL